MKYFDRTVETLPADRLAQLQLERLQALIVRLKRNVRRYRELLGDRRVEALAELAALPTTGPEDLADAFPYGMFALPLREVIRLYSIVGPQGRQLVAGHTRNDLTRWGRLVARQLVAADLTAHDVVQISFGGGSYNRSLGFMLGAETIEASVIPEAPFHIQYQLSTLRSYRATVLVTTPTNAHALAQQLQAQRVDPQALNLLVVFLTRPVPPEEREQLRAGLFADVRAGFGVPEVLDPGLCVLCGEGRHHVNEDEFLPEIVDGELVLTTLCREALPLLRYRTRVAAELRREKCPCGRTGATLVPGGRLDGRLLINEMPLYREQVAEVLGHTPAAGHGFHLAIGERHVVVTIEVTEALFDDAMGPLVELKRRIRSEFLARLGVEADVRYVGPGQLPAAGSAATAAR